MNILSKSLAVGSKNVHLFHPEGDDTIFGTASSYSHNDFRLSTVNFQPGDVLVDIGSNIGMLSLIVASLNPGVRVFSFDASPTAIRCLRTGVCANQLTNVQSYGVAIGADDAKTVKFYSNGKDNSCLVEEGLNSSNPVLDCEVPKIKIDEIFDSGLLGIDRVKYLKMDIEGGEFAIFDRLFQHRPDILDRIEYLNLEVHNYREFNPQGLKDRVRQRFGDKAFIID